MFKTSEIKNNLIDGWIMNMNSERNGNTKGFYIEKCTILHNKRNRN